MEKIRLFVNKWLSVLALLILIVWLVISTFSFAFYLGKAVDDWNDIAHQVITECTTEYLLENWGNEIEPENCSSDR